MPDTTSIEDLAENYVRTIKKHPSVHQVKMMELQMEVLKAMIDYISVMKINKHTSEESISIGMQSKKINGRLKNLRNEEIQQVITLLDSIEKLTSSREDLQEMRYWLTTFQKSKDLIKSFKSDMYAELQEKDSILFAYFEAIFGEATKDIKEIHKDFKNLLDRSEKFILCSQKSVFNSHQSTYEFFDGSTQVKKVTSDLSL